MATDFRSAVFSLCKMLSKHPESEKTHKTIHNISTIVESVNDENKTIMRPPHGDLGYVGKNHRIQFLGYLLADEAVEEINKIQPFHATHLELDERMIIEQAHKTVRLFIDLCISDIRNKFPKVSILIDPYSQYKHPKMMDNIQSFLSEDDYLECVESFKAGRVYQKVVKNDALKFLEIVDDDALRQIATIQRKQFADDLKSISKETENYFRKIQTNAGIEDVEFLMTYSIYCQALRYSLEIAAQMIFEAMMGENLAVMDNDNIINLTSHENNIVYEKIGVLIQGVLPGIVGGSIGSLALLVCDPTENSHLKEFGMIVSLTVSYKNEFGSTSKITIVTVDDELNAIHRFTDAILETDLGKSEVVYHGINL